LTSKNKLIYNLHLHISFSFFKEKKGIGKEVMAQFVLSFPFISSTKSQPLVYIFSLIFILMKGTLTQRDLLRPHEGQQGEEEEC
jgi:hypothetical protein